jgi:aldose 1-epimerase
MTQKVFGALRDGRPVIEARFGSDALSVSVINLGAALHDLRLAGAADGRALVLGYPRVEDYTDRDFRTGAIVGRFANRIAHGRFQLDGRTYQLGLNDEGVRHLHGGALGFSQRLWEIIDLAPDHLELRLVSEAGDEGYPGRLVTTCRYQADGRRVSIILTARTDAPTLVSLAPHGYFNLEGRGDVLGHRLQVAGRARPYPHGRDPGRRGGVLRLSADAAGGR